VNHWRREFGPERRYENIPYYSDLARFLPDPSCPEPGPGAHTVLYSGSLVPRKGVDLLCEAFREVSGSFPSLRLFVCGDGPLRRRLETLMAPLRERVRFLGFTPWEDLPRIYHEAHFLCVPSRYDGWGLVVPEGLAAGLPVISTCQTGAAVDLLEHGKNGWLLPAGDRRALVDVLATAASMGGEEWRSLSRSALQRSREHSLQSGADRFLAAARRAWESWPSGH
jgi:glycosyltransferase involved in cell wall biosynthesis